MEAGDWVQERVAVVINNTILTSAPEAHVGHFAEVVRLFV